MSSVYWLTRSGVAIAGKTPRPIRHSLASTISTASYLGWRSKRLVTQQNMAHVLGLPVTDARVKRAALDSWSNYGRTASDLIYFPHMNLERIESRIQDLSQGMSWYEYVAEPLARGKGAVVATAHFGSWDLAGAMVARRFPISAIVDTFKDPRLNDLLQGHRREKKMDVIPADGSARRILHDLHANRVVAIVVDRPMSKEKGIEVTFFGSKTYVPGGPAALALKAGAAVLPGYVWYAPGNRHYVRAFPPMYPQAVEGPEEKAEEIRRLTQYIYSCQEEVIRTTPTQWFMFRPFWPAEAETSMDEAAPQSIAR